MNDYDEIRNYPSCIKIYIDGISRNEGYHESLLRAYHILDKVKYLLKKNTNPKVVLELIDLMDTPIAEKEPPTFKIHSRSYRKRMKELLKEAKKISKKEKKNGQDTKDNSFNA